MKSSALDIRSRSRSPGKRESNSANWAKPGCWVILRPHVTRLTQCTAREHITIHTQLYSRVPSLSDAEHTVHGFYLSVSRCLWLASTSRQSRRLVIDKYRAGWPLGRSAARC